MTDALRENKVEITIPEMKQILPVLWSEGPRRVTTRIVGASGVGKTEAVIQCAVECGFEYVKINVPAEIPEPADALGLPDIIDRRTIYVPPYWVVEINNLAESTDKEVVVLILDEPGRAQLQILQALMPVALEYRVGSATLHPKVRQVWIDNPSEGTDYSVRTMDFAQEQRVQTFYLTYNDEAFFKYALVNNFHPEFFAFLKSYPEVLWNAEKDSPGPVSPRTAEFGSQACYGLEQAKIDLESSLAFKRLVARLGVEVTTSFMTNLRSQKYIIQPKDIIDRTFRKEDLARVLDVEKSADLLWLTFYRLASELTRRENLKGQQLANTRQFIMDNISDELNVVFFKMLPDKKALHILDAKLHERLKDRISLLPS